MTVKPYVFVILILLSYTLFGFPFYGVYFLTISHYYLLLYCLSF